MLRRILLAALVAGVAAGVVASLLQFFKVWPVILAAEVYEEAANAANEHAASDNDWQPTDGLQRIGFSVLFNVLAGFGFALILNALFALRRALGHLVEWREGVLWGIGGFAAVIFAPSLGLPPEAPGMLGADLAARQMWWVGTALATAAGLGGLVLGANWRWRALGLLLIVLPHVVGAPQAEAEHGGLPAMLAMHYVTATLVAGALFWLVLGGVSGWMQRRLG
jgi:cobalt transporter subunit CbtA